MTTVSAAVIQAAPVAFDVEATLEKAERLAAELLERLKATAAADGFRALSLSVEPDNNAKRIYERAGFEPAGGSGGSVTLMATL